MLWSTLNTLLCKTFVISSLPTSSPPHRRCRLVLLHIYWWWTNVHTNLAKKTYYYCYHYHNRQLNSTQQPNNYCWYATKQPTTNSRVVPPTVPLLLLLQCSPMCTYMYMQFCMFTFVTNPIYTKSPCNSATTFGNITNTNTSTTTTNKQHLLVIWTKWKQNLQYFVMHCVLFCLLDNDDDDGPEDGC